MFRTLKIAAAAVLVVAAAAAGYGWWAWKQIDAIPRFATPAVVTPPAAPRVTETVTQKAFLVFSVGSKGLDDDAVLRSGVGEARGAMADGLTDTLMLVLVNPSDRGVAVVSIPRDTLVPSSSRRINEAYNRGGIELLLSEVQELTGIRAEHQISVNFAAFSDLTAAVGGVDLFIPHRVVDRKARLSIENPGCVHLEGADALAFARSRHWLVLNSDGSARADATSSDWGRIARQQALLKALARKLANPSLAIRVPELLAIARQNLTLDTGLGTTDLLGLARAFADGVALMPTATFPGRGAVVDGASVIIPDIAAGLALVERAASDVGYRVPSESLAAATTLPNPGETSTTLSDTPGGSSSATPALSDRYQACSPGHAPRS